MLHGRRVADDTLRMRYGTLVLRLGNNEATCQAHQMSSRSGHGYVQSPLVLQEADFPLNQG